MFFFHAAETKSEKLPLDYIAIELKSAGHFTDMEEVRCWRSPRSRTDGPQSMILKTLHGSGVDELSFIEFLARCAAAAAFAHPQQSYLPLFLGIHDSILTNPLQTAKPGPRHNDHPEQ